jgi:16S rRNA (guanine1516-N2)-methyltransferase
MTSASALARDLRLPYLDAAQAGRAGMALFCTAEQIELHDYRDPRVGPIVVDFVTTRRREPITRRQPLARAIGAKNHLVADATAGFGRDAWLIATLGFHVVAFERCPVIAVLLRDGLQRARASGAPATTSAERVTLIDADARTALLGLHPKPDVVYLDPMFPPKRRKSAAARKEVRALRRLAGDDEDALELFEIASRCASDRVVVKRSDDAPPLIPRPTVSYAGKLVRYDVYFTRH